MVSNSFKTKQKNRNKCIKKTLLEDIKIEQSKRETRVVVLKQTHIIQMIILRSLQFVKKEINGPPIKIHFVFKILLV